MRGRRERASRSRAGTARRRLIASSIFAVLLVGAVTVTAGGGAPPPGIGFRGDLEGGSSGWQGLGWLGLQYEIDRPIGDSFAIVTSPVRQGRRAAEIIVKQGYSRWGANEDTELVFHSGESEGD